MSKAFPDKKKSASSYLHPGAGGSCNQPLNSFVSNAAVFVIHALTVDGGHSCFNYNVESNRKVLDKYKRKTTTISLIRIPATVRFVNFARLGLKQNE